MQPLQLNFQVDIAEQGFINGDFIIQGVAINSVVTSNNTKFLTEELRKSAETLKGVPLLKDHENLIDSIMGRVLSGTFNEEGENVLFKAKVIDEKAQGLIKDRRLNTVSIGAIVESMDEEDGLIIPRGIIFKELSLVAVPADSGATFEVALKEAYNNKDKKRTYTMEELEAIGNALINTKIVKKEDKMTEEQESTETSKASEETSEEAPAEPEKEPEKDKEAEVDAKLKVARIALKMKELAIIEKKLKQADEDEKPEPKAETKKEEPKEEAKEDEEEEAEEVAEEKYNIVRSSHNSFTLVR